MCLLYEWMNHNNINCTTGDVRQIFNVADWPFLISIRKEIRYQINNTSLKKFSAT
jgi:hypothetical protein